MRYFAAPIPSVPIQQRGERIARAQLGTASHCPRQTSAATGYGGDYGIVSHHGDVILQEPLYDTLTQLESDQHAASSDGQGSCKDVATSDISEEEETISDISAEASDSLCYDTDGNVFGY